MLPVPAEWQPVLAAELRTEAPAVSAQRPEQDAFRAEIARRADELGLQPLRWPDPFPFDSALAMRVATYAKSIGRTVPFAQAAFRQAFAGGRSLEHPDSVLIAAAACEMHPTAVLAAAERRGVAEELSRATAAAAAAGVRELPAVTVGGELFAGADALERADVRMRASSRALGGWRMGGGGVRG